MALFSCLRSKIFFFLCSFLLLTAQTTAVAFAQEPALIPSGNEGQPGQVVANTERPKGPLPKTFLLVAPLTGVLAEFGQQARRGAELALKTWGGGFSLEVIDENGSGSEEVDYTKVAVVIGYFTETAFQQDAPRYLYLKKPVLLPYLTNPEAAARSPYSFFRLMPTYDEQGRFMAMEILNMKKRPSRILIIQGDDENQAELVGALKETLEKPVQQEKSETRDGKKNARALPRVNPLDSRAQVVSVSVSQAFSPDSISEFSKREPEIIIMAVGLPDALMLAPVLADSKLAKSAAIWGGASLGFREVGASYASLKLKLSLCLPAVSLVQGSPKTLVDFKNAYVSAWRTQPTWISALSYDAVNIAIKGAANTEEGGDMLTFLTSQSHHCLGDYELAPGGRGGKPSLGLMPVRLETLGFLP